MKGYDCRECAYRVNLYTRAPALCAVNVSVCKCVCMIGGVVR